MYIKSYSFLTAVGNKLDSLFKIMNSQYYSVIFVIFTMAFAVGYAYSMLLAIWIGSIGVFSFLVREKDEVEDNSLIVGSALSIFIFVLVSIGATFNVYDGEPIDKTLEVESYKFVESTEKVVISVEDEIMVFVSQSNIFFKMQQYDGKPMTITYIKKPQYDHYDKLFYDSTPSSHTFDVILRFGDDYSVRYIDHCIRQHSDCKELF
jgi:hypothetical protein